MKKQIWQIAGITIFFLLVIGGIFYFVKKDLSGLSAGDKVLAPGNGFNNSYNNGENKVDASIPPIDDVAENIAASARAGFNIFTHQAPEFSFEYPVDLNIGKFSEGEGEIILAQTAESASGFQIYINPFDEEGPITKERILKDAPAMIVDQPEPISIGGAPALSFYSGSQSSGKTFEVWFARGGYLFQITAQADFAEQLEEILASWKYNY